MRIIYTKHAEEKLLRKDVQKFKINKQSINKIIKRSRLFSNTKYGERAVIGNLDSKHILRIIYAIIESDIKVIAFHIAHKGRY